MESSTEFRINVFFLLLKTTYFVRYSVGLPTVQQATTVQLNLTHSEDYFFILSNFFLRSDPFFPTDSGK